MMICGASSLQPGATFGGGRSAILRRSASVAQGIERSPPERKAAGSNPAGGTSGHGANRSILAATVLTSGSRRLDKPNRSRLQESIPVTMKPSRQLRDIALGLWEDLTRSDPRAFVERFSKSDATVYIGSDPEEFIEGGPQVRAILTKQIEEMRAQGIERQKSQPSTSKPRWRSERLSAVHAFEEGTVGWATFRVKSDRTWITQLEVDPDGKGHIGRMTFIFHREDAEWKVVHMHWSFGLSNEQLGLKLTTAIEEVADLVDQERPNLMSLTSPEGTVTIMFTDIEESTATNETLGDDAFLPLLLRHNDIVSTRTELAGGTIVKSQGDGFMLAFPSARRGVNCAIAIQREVSSFDDRIRVRMGLHTGEPVREADDFFGRDVAYAARIGAAAIGGEILVSSLVKSLVEPSGSIVFEGPRRLELKGFDGPQTVYAVTL